MAQAGRVERLGDAVILYDPLRMDHPREEWFAAERWPALDGGAGAVRGRGRVVLVSCADQQWVLRRYLRGGLIGRLVRNRYLWTGAEGTRCFREWRLLFAIRQLGLPVPAPVAARFTHAGPTYRAELLTVRIPGLISLAGRLPRDFPDAGAWRRVGACLRRFHDAGVCHADLNAHNVHFDSAGVVQVLDFDRGRMMAAPGSWQERNLRRLRRSLEKVWPAGTRTSRSEAWKLLLQGYQDRAASGAA